MAVNLGVSSKGWFIIQKKTTCKAITKELFLLIIQDQGVQFLGKNLRSGKDGVVSFLSIYDIWLILHAYFNTFMYMFIYSIVYIHSVRYSRASKLWCVMFCFVCLFVCLLALLCFALLCFASLCFALLALLALFACLLFVCSVLLCFVLVCCVFFVWLFECFVNWFLLLLVLLVSYSCCCSFETGETCCRHEGPSCTLFSWFRIHGERGQQSWKKGHMYKYCGSWWRSFMIIWNLGEFICFRHFCIKRLVD